MASLKDIIKASQKLGYKIDKSPYKLNLIGVRNSAATSQKKFDDEIAYFYYDENGKLYGKVAVGTTDPSTYWLNAPMNRAGAAILTSGEYKDTWKLGLHRGKYTALVQKDDKPVTVIRDNDRNSYINYFAPTQTGVFGINIHKASLGANKTSLINEDSAGCQVFRDIPDYDEMIRLAQKSREKYGNSFSYILIDDRDALKFRNTTLLVGGLLIIASAVYLLVNKKK